MKWDFTRNNQSSGISTNCVLLLCSLFLTSLNNFITGIFLFGLSISSGKSLKLADALEQYVNVLSCCSSIWWAYSGDVHTHTRNKTHIIMNIKSETKFKKKHTRICWCACRLLPIYGTMVEENLFSSAFRVYKPSADHSHRRFVPRF